MSEEKIVTQENNGTTQISVRLDTSMVIFSVGMFAVFVGLTYPLFSILLDMRGATAALIGANAAMTPLGIFASTIIAPILTDRVRPSWFAVACALMGAAVLVMMKINAETWVWFFGRLVLGFVIGSIYMFTKAWINELAENQRRGQIVGVYTTVLAAGFSVGPFALAAIGSQGWLPFLVAIAALVITATILFVVARRIPYQPTGQRGSSLSFLPVAPVLLFCVAMFGFFDQTTLALLPSYGFQFGFSEASMAFSLGVLNAGNVLFQIPIGWLADRYSRRAVLVGCAAIAAFGAVVLPAAMTTPNLLWPLLFVWGAAAYGVSTVSITELGDRFAGRMLLSGSAALTMMHGVGGVSGPLVVGAVVDVFGPQGLPVVLAICFGALTLTCMTFKLVRLRSS